MFGMVWYCMVCYAILMYAMHGTYFIYIYPFTSWLYPHDIPTISPIKSHYQPLLFVIKHGNRQFLILTMYRYTHINIHLYAYVYINIYIQIHIIYHSHLYWVHGFRAMLAILTWKTAFLDKSSTFRVTYSSLLHIQVYSSIYISHDNPHYAQIISALFSADWALTPSPPKNHSCSSSFSTVAGSQSLGILGS